MDNNFSHAFTNRALLLQEQFICDWISDIEKLIEQKTSFGILNASISKQFKLDKALTDFKNAYPLHLEENGFNLICFTAGSNGRFKAIVRSYESWVNSFKIQQEIIQYPSNTKSLIVGDCSHSLHFFGLLESLYRNVEPIVLASFSTKKFFAACNKELPQLLYITPVHLGLLLRHFNAFDVAPVLSIRYLVVGGATINSSTLKKVQLMFPNATIHEFFGATETSYISIKTPNCPLGSVGKICPGVTVRIMDSEHKLVPVGNVGNIWVKSNQLFRRTVMGEDATLCDDNGFIHIGDMGYVDKNNHLYYVGRNNHQVTIAGKNILLTPIEKCIQNHLQTPEVAVISVTDALKENRLSILTSLTLTKEHQRALLLEVRKEFGALATPKTIVSIPSWPLLASGKTNRTFLQKLVSP
ncbi:MAG: AMP-binding protein [Flavobacteriaceae bacterium]|nr:AMP-binding protein [Flavobacteriaceae bacterium]